MWAYARFGAVPVTTASVARKKARKAVLLATGSVVLRRNSKGHITLRFSAAGRKALRAGRAVRIRIRVQMTYNHQRHVFIYTSKISALHRAAHHRH